MAGPLTAGCRTPVTCPGSCKDSPHLGVLFPLAGAVLSSELLPQTLKLCVRLGRGQPRAICHLPCRLPRAALRDPFLPRTRCHCGMGEAGYTCPRGLCFPHCAGRCAWSRSARRRVWSRCAASWTRRRSGTLGTSRTAEASPPSGDCLLHSERRPRLWGSRDRVFPSLSPGLGDRATPPPRSPPGSAGPSAPQDDPG